MESTTLHADPIGVKSRYQYSFLFTFEEEFDMQAKRQWFAHNWTLSIYLVAVYLLVVFGLKWYMKPLPRLELRWSFVLWNAVLAFFSLLGSIRMAPDLLYDIRRHGIQYSMCDISFIQHNKVACFWGWLFAVSKAVELGDTVFLVLRKRKLTFLHVYHHVSVCLGAWYFINHKLGPARWFPVVNYTIHAVMYTYFALKLLRFRIPRWVSMCITLAQILQMVIGILGIAFVYTVLARGDDCEVEIEDTKPAMVLGVSYFWLFTYFFYDAYLKKPDGKLKKLD